MYGDRSIIESLYQCVCNVYTYQESEDPDTLRQVRKLVKIYENEPCRISYKDYYNTEATESNKIFQRVKLIISPDVKIPPGSKIEVLKNGNMLEFRNSTNTKVYTNHQEIDINLIGERA